MSYIIRMSKARSAKCSIRSRRAISLRDGGYHKVENNQNEPLSFSVTIKGNKLTNISNRSESSLTFNLGDQIKI